MRLERIYIDNYKCLVDFELKLHDTVTLLMGPNGGGKSTVFEVLRALRAFVADGASVDEAFDRDILPRWQASERVTFRLVFASDLLSDGAVTYELRVSTDPRRHPHHSDTAIASETVTLDDRPVIARVGEAVDVYSERGEVVSNVAVESDRSILGVLKVEFGFLAVERLRDWFADLQVARPLASSMRAVSQLESVRRLTPDAENFADWYRHTSNEHQGALPELFGALREAIEGFHGCRLRDAGRARVLQIRYRAAESDRVFDVDFDEASDGERQLVALYSLVAFLAEDARCLMLDEPGNFLALPQLQPWIIALRDVCVERGLQAVIISHHPEIIDYLAPDAGLWIEREPGGPTKPPQRVEPGDEADGGLKLSELIAMRWAP